MKETKLKHLITTLFFTLALVSCSLFQRSHSPEEEVSNSTPAVDSPSSSSAVETAKPRGDRKRITLVLGGAGVASFATVGILKRLQEESIDVELLVTSGWPTLFALARGFMGSIHDVEWFAMRLNEKDFAKLGDFDVSQKDAENESVSKLIQRNFKDKEIRDSKIPILVSTRNSLGAESEVYDRGEWKTPLLRTMSVPGIFRKFPKSNEPWLATIQGLDISEAQKRGGKIIVTVEMYQDYLAFLKTGKKDFTEGSPRKLYLKSLEQNLANELKRSEINGHIELNSSPLNFSQKRLAILAGYREGARLAKAIRKIQ